jgi:coenzyme F420-reducing hydrogenase beta subunit
LETIIGFAKDEELRIESSSGGMFSIFAEKILAKGGIVYGVVLDDDMRAVHTCTENSDCFSAMRGSKYIQSRINDSYKDIKKMLLEGRIVLFTGTPCQIAGLKSYLGREYDNLYTIDLLCHGVPSEKVWEKYIHKIEFENNAKVVRASFRKKVPGWRDYSMEITLDDSRIIRTVYKEDEFMKMFLSDICLRPSCYNCRFKNLERASDITIGDCWQVKNFMPDMDDDKGTSIIIIHSEKGMMLFDKIKTQIEYRLVDIDTALPPYSKSRNSVTSHADRRNLIQIIESL